MKCPVCEVALSISSREGVEIDFCPQCRGVWLDRGELDKIIDRVAVSQASTGFDAPPPLREVPGDDRGRESYDDRRGDWDDDRSRGSKKKRRRGFLDDLFEFD